MSVDVSGGRARPERHVDPVPGDRPGPFRIRLRVPAPRGGDPGTVLVEVQVGEPPIPLDGCQLMELTFSQGASSDAGVVTTADAGGGTIRLVDPNRIFDPANDASHLAGIGTTVRILLNGATAFRGRIDAIGHDLAVATLSLVDGVAALAGYQFVETSVPAESSSARITRILNLASWPTDRRDIGTGGRALQAGTVAADAWSELVAVTRNELGTLWMTSDGKVAWRNRTEAWTGSPPAMSFGCEPSDAFIGTMTTRGDQSDLVNILAAARRTGTQATVQDDTSLKAFGRHSHVQNDLELATDDERDLWQNFYLVRQAYPVNGIEGFSMRPDSTAIAKVLALPLGAIVRVYDEHHGPVIDLQVRWLGAKWAVTSSYVQVDAVVGEDASIKQVARTTSLDYADEFRAATFGAVAANRPGPGVGPDLQPNGSFESDFTGWNINAGAAVTIDTNAANIAPGTAGTKAARVTGNGTAVSPGISSASFIPVVPGMTYRVRAWAKRIAGTTSVAYLNLHARDAGGSGVQFNAVALLWSTATSGTYLEGWYAVPADGSVACITIAPGISGTPAATESWNIDDVSVVGGNVDFGAMYGDLPLSHVDGQPGLVYQDWPPE